jgi:hypothetical protein
MILKTSCPISELHCPICQGKSLARFGSEGKEVGCPNNYHFRLTGSTCFLIIGKIASNDRVYFDYSNHKIRVSIGDNEIFYNEVFTELDEFVKRCYALYQELQPSILFL